MNAGSAGNSANGGATMWVSPGNDGWQYITMSHKATITEEAGMEVFEYIVVYTGDDEWKGAKVLVGPKIAIAEAEEVVKMEAARAIPKAYEDKLDDIDIYVRKWAA